MKKTLKLSLALLGFAMIFGTTSCKKYEEGPSLSLRSKKARVANTWVFDKYIVDGTEADLAASGLDKVEAEYKKDGNYHIKSNGTEVDHGTWEFGDKKETIITTDEDGDKDTATIIKLKNKELWTKDTWGGVTYESRMKAKE